MTALSMRSKYPTVLRQKVALLVAGAVATTSKEDDDAAAAVICLAVADQILGALTDEDLHTLGSIK